MNWKVNAVIMALIAFASTNVYWLLTVVYVYDVAELGSPSVLYGFQAASKLIELHGIQAYLSGAYSYFIFVLVGLIIANYVLKPKTKLMKVVGLLGCALAVAIVYYLISVTVRIQDRVEGIDITLSGSEAFAEIGFLGIVFGIVGIWIIFSITFLIDLGIKSILKNKIVKQGAT